MLVLRGLRLGAGYGLAFGAVHAWVFAVQLAAMNMPAMEAVLLKSAAIEIAIFASLGAVLSPLLRFSRGWLWHLLTMVAIWCFAGLATSPAEPFLLLTMLGPPLAAVPVGLAGHWVASRSLRVAVAIGAALLLAAPGYSLWYESRISSPDEASRDRARAPEDAPDIVLVVLDTVRARNMSAYGYHRPTTPTFDGLAAEGALFEEAASASNWSLPSHASLFTGLFASVHGAHNENHHMREDVPTLAGTLAAAGWDTASFTANPWISDALGTARGFDFEDESWRRDGGNPVNATFRFLELFGYGPKDKGGASVAGAFDAWLAERGRGAPPFFAFLNFIEAHFPYHQVPAEYLRSYTDPALRESDLRDLSLRLMADQFGGADLDPEALSSTAIDMYDGGVRYADHLLSRVLESLEQRGRPNDTIVVVVSDHGELIGNSDGVRAAFDLASEGAEHAGLSDGAAAESLEAELALWRATLGLPAAEAELTDPGVAPSLDAAARERLRALGYLDE